MFHDNEVCQTIHIWWHPGRTPPAERTFQVIVGFFGEVCPANSHAKGIELACPKHDSESFVSVIYPGRGGAGPAPYGRSKPKFLEDPDLGLTGWRWQNWPKMRDVTFSSQNVPFHLICDAARLRIFFKLFLKIGFFWTLPENRYIFLELVQIWRYRHISFIGLCSDQTWRWKFSQVLDFKYWVLWFRL